MIDASDAAALSVAPIQRANSGSAINREVALPFAAGVVLLSASLANFLNRSDYSFFRADVGLVIAVFALISVVVTLIYRTMNWPFRAALEGLLAGLFVDLNSSETSWAIAAGVLVGAVVFRRRRSLAGPMAIFGSVVLITTLLGFQGHWSWVRTTEGKPTHAPSAIGQPAILHIILDEHIGLEGMPVMGPDGVKLRDELRATYLGAGFSVFGRAYSEHMHTVNAIPSVLNYGRTRTLKHSFTGVAIGPTEHVRFLSKAGYAVNIFQSDFADLCTGAPYSRCTTYDSFSLRPLLNFPLSLPERSQLIGVKFLTVSGFGNAALYLWNTTASIGRRAGLNLPNISLSGSALTSSAATFVALDELKMQLSRAKPGDAFIVHLLLPHYPYVLAKDCTMLPRQHWDRRNTKSDISLRQKAYMDQLRCVTSQTMQAVKIFQASTAGKDATIVIHGDHGSRITNVDPRAGRIGKFNDSDLIAGFSTLFAVHTSSSAATYVSEPQPIATLMRRLSENGFRQTPRAMPLKRHDVFLDNQRWEPSQRLGMPVHWLAGDGVAAAKH
jgi:hypothetical protein